MTLSLHDSIRNCLKQLDNDIDKDENFLPQSDRKRGFYHRITSNDSITVKARMLVKKSKWDEESQGPYELTAEDDPKGYFKEIEDQYVLDKKRLDIFGKPTPGGFQPINRKELKIGDVVQVLISFSPYIMNDGRCGTQVEMDEVVLINTAKV